MTLHSSYFNYLQYSTLSKLLVAYERIYYQTTKLIVLIYVLMIMSFKMMMMIMKGERINCLLRNKLFFLFSVSTNKILSICEIGGFLSFLLNNLYTCLV